MSGERRGIGKSSTKLPKKGETAFKTGGLKQFAKKYRDPSYENENNDQAMQDESQNRPQQQPANIPQRQVDPGQTPTVNVARPHHLVNYSNCTEDVLHGSKIT